MTDYIAGGNRMTRQNIECQCFQRNHLQFGKGPVAEIVPGVYQFDPDRARIETLVPAPIRDAGMPRTLCFRYKLKDTAVFLN